MDREDAGFYLLGLRGKLHRVIQGHGIRLWSIARLPASPDAHHHTQNGKCVRNTQSPGAMIGEIVGQSANCESRGPSTPPPASAKRDRLSRHFTRLRFDFDSGVASHMSQLADMPRESVE